jgi:DNA-binding MarR family transcriptional regulator
VTDAPDRVQLATDLRLTVGRLNRKLRIRAASGLTPSQSSILANLATAGPLHLGELARREAVTAPSASRVVERLVELGLVERTADPEDARRHILNLTRDGRDAAARGDDAATRMLAEALDQRTDVESQALQRIVPVLRAIIDDLHAGIGAGTDARAALT